MKDFFTQCLLDLNAITGIEQVRWLQNDLVDGKRNFTLCVDSMVKTCELFDYIPEAEQQKVIRRMMIEDKDYSSLNSRTVYKWLALFKDEYYRGQTHFEERPTVVPTYAEYLSLCTLNKVEPLTEQEYDKPIDVNRIGMYGKKISDIAETMTVPRSSLAKEFKKKLEKIECKHTGQFIEDVKGRICCDCGKELTNEK